VLVAYQSSQVVEESKTDTELAEEAMSFLRSIYSNASNPTKSVVTRWTNDPFSYGAYSYIPPGASGADYEVMAAPVAGRLFFAGEATNRRHPSSVCGAYLSGKREAVRIETLYSTVPVDERDKGQDELDQTNTETTNSILQVEDDEEEMEKKEQQQKQEEEQEEKDDADHEKRDGSNQNQ